MSSIIFGYNLDANNWGCRSTPNILRDLISNRFKVNKVVSNINLVSMKDDDIKKEIMAFDHVIINGEGSPIFTTPSRKEFLKHLYVLEVARLLNKKVHYINCMISSCPSTGLNEAVFNRAISIFNKCDTFSVRDSHSFQIISKHCKNVRYIPDALFTLKNNRGFKYDDLIKPVDVNLNEMPDNCIAISGGSWPLSKAQPVEVKKESYTRLINRILESGKKVALISTCNGDRWLEDLAKDLDVYHVPAAISSKKFIDVFKKVKIFISGRFHPSIMASTLGIPCIFFESNSHKTMSLQKDLKYKDIKVYKMPLSDSDINSILSRIDEYIETFEEHSSKILKTVEVLSKSVTTNGLFKKIKKNE